MTEQRKNLFLSNTQLDKNKIAQDVSPAKHKGDNNHLDKKVVLAICRLLNLYFPLMTSN